MSHPTLSEEKKTWQKGYKRVVGLDEAGRGPLAGPVVAAAVSIERFSIFNFQFSEIRDSKKLSSKQREKFYRLIKENKSISWGMGVVSEKVIDKINIKNAAELAMEKAFNVLRLKTVKHEQKTLFLKTCFLIIDGNSLKNHKLKTISHKLIVRADEKVFSVALASILAKVARDRIMGRYHKKFPLYGFNRHKGYPTKLHVKLLKKHGPCKIHRKSFWPVKACKVK
jgi:ribonuclease HII